MDVKTEKPEANSDTRVTVVAKTLDGVTVNASIEIPLGDDKKADLKKYFPYLKQAFSRYIGSAKANALGSRENRTELIMILSEVANEELPPNLRVKEIVLIQLDINAQGPAQ